MKFAVALNDQGRFAPTQVLEFSLLPECNAHVWKGMVAESMKDLADQVNCASAFLDEFGGPFIKLRVLEVGQQTPDPADEEKPTLESVNRSLIQANAELNQVIEKIGLSRPTLKLIERVSS
jgi:lysyl-tRNA synthetase class I